MYATHFLTGHQKPHPTRQLQNRSDMATLSQSSTCNVHTKPIVSSTAAAAYLLRKLLHLQYQPLERLLLLLGFNLLPVWRTALCCLLLLLHSVLPGTQAQHQDSTNASSCCTCSWQCTTCFLLHLLYILVPASCHAVMQLAADAALKLRRHCKERSKFREKLCLTTAMSCNIEQVFSD